MQNDKRNYCADGRTTDTSAKTRDLPGWPPRPPGEDYHLLEISIDTPENVGWDDGFHIAGSWAQLTAVYASTVELLNLTKRKGSFKLTQGRALVNARLEVLWKEEIRYQQEMSGIGRN